jgi:hypothetical protein
MSKPYPILAAALAAKGRSDSTVSIAEDLPLRLPYVEPGRDNSMTDDRTELVPSGLFERESTFWMGRLFGAHSSRL